MTPEERSRIDYLAPVGTTHLISEIYRRRREWIDGKMPEDRSTEAMLLDLFVSFSAQYFGYQRSSFISFRRYNPLCQQRQMAMTVARKKLQLPLTMVGEHFGGRDHGTVIHAVKKVEGSEELSGRARALGAAWNDHQRMLAGKPKPEKSA